MRTDNEIKETFLHHGKYVKAFLYPYNQNDLDVDYNKMIANENFTTFFATVNNGQPYPWKIDFAEDLFERREK
jgi:hypothetical protein